MFKFLQNLNEFFVFIVIMNLFCFADVIPVGPESMFGNKTMGYALMIIVSVNLVFNFSYIMGKSIKQSFRNLRTKYLLWRRKKLSEALEKFEISKAL
jgi:cell shape-determining protein MreD